MSDSNTSVGYVSAPQSASVRVHRAVRSSSSLFSGHALRLAAMVGAALLVSACHHKSHVARAPQPTRRTTSPSVEARIGHIEEGIASWYGIPYHGRPAADGEIYDMEKLVAAHRLLPFNTWLRVTNLNNSKTVDVRVIDRGPFVDGRIIDLSKAAAREIDLLGPGVGRVRLEVISSPLPASATQLYAVQTGAFSVQANADRARVEGLARFGSAQIVTRQGKTVQYRVLVGRWSSLPEAQLAVTQLEAEGRSAFVVHLDDSTPGTRSGATESAVRP